jgi:hypothetical protein
MKAQNFDGANWPDARVEGEVLQLGRRPQQGGQVGLRHLQVPAPHVHRCGPGVVGLVDAVAIRHDACVGHLQHAGDFLLDTGSAISSSLRALAGC